MNNIYIIHPKQLCVWIVNRRNTYITSPKAIFSPGTYMYCIYVWIDILFFGMSRRRDVASHLHPETTILLWNVRCSHADPRRTRNWKGKKSLPADMHVISLRGLKCSFTDHQLPKLTWNIVSRSVGDERVMKKKKKKKRKCKKLLSCFSLTWMGLSVRVSAIFLPLTHLTVSCIAA